MTLTSSPKNALVTGAGVRIGASIARDLARNGWSVALHCRKSRVEADALAAEIEETGGRAVVVVGDLVEPQAIYRLVREANSALGVIDLLVNSAAIFEDDKIGALDPELFDRQMRTNLTAPCLLADAFVSQLPDEHSGNIINIIDQRVLKLTPQFFSYTLSKSALWTATQTLAQALAPRIRVNAIGPGPTALSSRQSADDFALQSAAVPLGFGPRLEEFGRTIRFLVETPSITGQLICLDGGQHLAWETADVVGVGE
jgi:NAD(P)-dependent dehydrogenase (short-subunit alcohol dehydrogenase family)